MGTSGSKRDLESPPWTYSTVTGFALLFAVSIGLPLLSVMVVTEAAAKGEPPPYGVAAVNVLFGCVPAFVLVRALRRRAVGRAVISFRGVEFHTWRGPVRRFPWDEIVSVGWNGSTVTLRTPTDELIVVWSLLPARDQPHAREWVRASLEPWFALVDVPRPPQPVSYARVLVATAVAAAPVLTAWQVLLRNPDASRLWALVFFLPLPALYAVAVVLIRRRGRGELWYHRASSDPANATVPPDPCAVLS